MSKRKGLFFLGMMVAVLIGAAGCRERKQGLTLHFVFEDAKGITVGKKVMGDGVFVGQVIAQPRSPKPNYVVVSVRIDGLLPEKMAFVTQDLSAVIRKDSLVTGEVFLDLVFPREPGETVADGTILKGRGSAGDLVSLAGLALPKDPKQFLETLGAAFVAVDPAKNGSVVFYLNWVCLIVAALVTVALVLDFLIRMPQGRERERSTPHILRETWTLFCLMLVLRFFLTVFRLLVGSGVLDADLLNVLHIGAVDLADLLKQEWPYWLLAIVLITIRFKFDLLTRVRDRSS